jgi:hypothetical protein
MLQPAANLKIRRFATNFIVAGALGLLGLMSATASQSVALNWNPGTGPHVAGYRIYYGPASHTYTNAIAVGNVTNAIISGLVEGATYYFGARTLDAAGVESGFSNETSYTIPAVAANTRPTLNPIANLPGISSDAANGKQMLKATVTSSDPALIANPTMAYVSPRSTGTVTVNDGGQSNNSFSRSFAATVLATANASAAVPIPAATLKAITRAASGKFSFQVAGVAGYKYVIQASSDLVHWSAVQTNTAPFIFTDTNAATLPRCFYRTFHLLP